MGWLGFRPQPGSEQSNAANQVYPEEVRGGQQLTMKRLSSSAQPAYTLTNNRKLMFCDNASRVEFQDFGEEVRNR